MTSKRFSIYDETLEFCIGRSFHSGSCVLEKIWTEASMDERFEEWNEKGKDVNYSSLDMGNVNRRNLALALSFFRFYTRVRLLERMERENGGGEKERERESGDAFTLDCANRIKSEIEYKAKLSLSRRSRASWKSTRVSYKWLRSLWEKIHSSFLPSLCLSFSPSLSLSLFFHRM